MIYIYVCIFIYLIQHWSPVDGKHFKVIFEMSCVQISAQRSLLLLKVQIFFTAWIKYLDIGII